MFFLVSLRPPAGTPVALGCQKPANTTMKQENKHTITTLSPDEPPMSHTPGPWRVVSYFDDDGEFQLDINVTHAHWKWEDTMCRFLHPEKVDEANARLIAAAPELYVATYALLEQLRSLCRRGIISEFELAEGLGSDIDTAQAAIEKANEGLA